jgi:hypothetical protein
MKGLGFDKERVCLHTCHVLRRMRRKCPLVKEDSTPSEKYVSVTESIQEVGQLSTMLE